MKLEAENSRRAEDIRRQGLFGTGITQENLNSLARTGLGIAQFGQDRMTNQMAQATERFQKIVWNGIKNSMIKYDQDPNDQKADMIDEHESGTGPFNDQMGKYRKSGMSRITFWRMWSIMMLMNQAFLQTLQKIVNKEKQQKEIKEVAKPKPQG